MIAAQFAPAKVNLFLHVGAQRADGHHPIETLMAFADVGDRLELTPVGDLSLALRGEFARSLESDALEDNLVLRAVRRLFALARTPPRGRLTLVKNLPVAAGLGGGSSDAGAALRLVRDEFALDVDDHGLAEIARALGADGVACFAARPVWAWGRGDEIEDVVRLPTLDAVLVNPRVGCATGAVYRAYDALDPAAAHPQRPSPPQTFANGGELIEYLRGCRNDLERPATDVAPEIADVLRWVRAQPEVHLGRLSGSGATAFAVCADAGSASALQQSIARAHPAWWCVACRLGGPWPLGEALWPAETAIVL